MSRDACVAKKLYCNPPAQAKMKGPELILDAIAKGLLDRKLIESAGLAPYLMRCAYLDEDLAKNYELAEAWLVENLRRIQDDNAKPLPVPDDWKTEY